MALEKQQFIIISIGELQEILNPIYSKLVKIEVKIEGTNSPEKSYFRNKDLKQIFGLSDNTILKYRDSGVLPYSYIDNIYFYPKDKIEKIIEDNSNWELFNKRAPE